MVSQSFNDYEFQHFIDFHNYDCVYCSTKEKTTGRTRLFIVFNEQRRIYMRNAKKDSWDELKDENFYDQVRLGFNEAVSNNRVPYFTTLLETMENLEFDHLVG